MPNQGQAQIVLTMWREVERELQTVVAGSAEAEALQADAARLRDEYQRLITLVLEPHRPVRPDLPQDAEVEGEFQPLSDLPAV